MLFPLASHLQRWLERGKAFEFVCVSDVGLVRFRKIWWDREGFEGYVGEGVLGRCNISTRAAVRVVQGVVGDCVNGEGSRVRVKLDSDFVSNSNILFIWLYVSAMSLFLCKLPMTNVNVSVQTYDSTEFTYPKTRIDRDYASRVLIPLEHFKLHVLDGSVLLNIAQSNRGNNTKSELNASIKDLISNIKVRWESALNLKEKKCNNLKDFLNVAGPMGVAHFLMPSKTVSSPDLRVASTMGSHSYVQD
ncbi:hypothetical protein Tco_0089015 [Tanacetum coccineum]